MPFKREEFKFAILKSIAKLSTEKNGWSKELNLVSFNDAEPKYDLRSWDADHKRMSKGISLNKEELLALKNTLNTLEM